MSRLPVAPNRQRKPLPASPDQHRGLGARALRGTIAPPFGGHHKSHRRVSHRRVYFVWLARATREHIISIRVMTRPVESVNLILRSDGTHSPPARIVLEEADCLRTPQFRAAQGYQTALSPVDHRQIARLLLDIHSRHRHRHREYECSGTGTDTVSKCVRRPPEATSTCLGVELEGSLAWNDACGAVAAQGWLT